MKQHPGGGVGGWDGYNLPSRNLLIEELFFRSSARPSGPFSTSVFFSSFPCVTQWDHVGGTEKLDVERSNTVGKNNILLYFFFNSNFEKFEKEKQNVEKQKYKPTIRTASSRLFWWGVFTTWNEHKKEKKRMLILIKRSNQMPRAKSHGLHVSLGRDFTRCTAYTPNMSSKILHKTDT